MELDSSILLQKQVKDNSEDLQNEFRDLKNWEEQMKRRDQELRNDPTEKTLPPIRRKKKKTLQTPESKENGAAKTQNRIKSNDYVSWDKFDVDKACKEVDKNNESDESGEEPMSREELEKNHDIATKHKEQGNIFVQQKKWSEALACYSEAIKVFPYDAIFYANRALCYLKMDNLYSAEADCSTALQLDENYVKAYHRRAMARMALKQYKEAKDDLERILKLEPSTKEATLLLAEVNNKIGNTKGKPLTEMVSEKVGEDYHVSQELNTETITVVSKSKQTYLPIPDWLPEKDNVDIVEAIVKPPHLRSKKPLKNIPIQEVDFKTPNYVKESVKCEMVEITNSEKVGKVIPKEKNNYTLPSECIKAGVIPRIPKTAVQFLMDWKTNKSAEYRYAYLKQIPPANIPLIFQDSMESDIFSSVLSTLKSEFIRNKEPIFSYLESLSHVKRLRALVMFMSNKDKEDLKSLFNYCKESEEKAESDVQTLCSKYEI